MAGGAGQGSCSRCGFPLTTYRALEVTPGSNLDGGVVTRPAIEFQNAGAVIRLADHRGVIVGRDDQAFDGFDVQTFRHRELQPRHVAFLAGESDSVWLVDLCPDQRGVFVDGRSTSLAQMVDGAVVQIGPLGWKFNQTKGLLAPVTPIAGFDLAVDAEVDGRLTATKLHLSRGEMTALVGPSGCGKSTLLETIRDGSGLAGDVDTAGRVFFVPQRDLVHHDLRLRDALLAIAGLYGRQPLPFEIDAALDSVGLPASAKDKFPGELSGGQLRRFRIAGALLSGAGVIVLDEPDSGLDHETAGEVIALLRSLAIRGATIVAVTHHRHVLDSFDRVITMRATPDGGAVEGTADAAPSSPGQFGLPDDQDDVPSAMYRFCNRMAILFRRERQKLTSPKLSRLSLGPLRVPHLVIGLLLVPVLFAVAIAISVPTDPDRDVADGLYGQMGPINRLGFLAVVSVIWMSASGSHLSITRDRELYDYERSYGVTWGQLLSAKTVVLAIAGMLQTLVFAGLLYVIRDRWLARSFFVDERATQLPGVVLCLLGVSIAATMLGLLISAMAGRGPLLAAAILPVVMMFQILFSAPFAISDPDGYEPLADYDSLTVLTQQQDAEEVDDDDWEDEWEDEWEDDWVEEQRPLWATSLFSYATLSRYGDKWLRSFAVTTEPPEQAGSVQRSSAAALAVISAICFAASWFVLWMQSTRLGIRRVRAVGLIAAAVILGSHSTPALAQPPTEASAEPGSTTIRLSLVEGRYDENKLRRAMGGRADGTPRWREFGNQDRLGLVTLELVGKIQFKLSDDELVIELKQTPKWDLMKQLAPPRLIGREDVGDADDVVVFVHGLEGGESTFAGAAEALVEQGIASMRFDYPNDGPPAEIGRRLAEQLTEFGREHPDANVHLVAHSLGGLVSTWAVTESDFPARMVPHVVTLGTPFRGSALASFHDELELFDVVVRLATGTRGALDTVADGRGEAAEALQPGSDFLRQLHRRERPAGIQFHLAAGTKSFLTKSRRDRLAAALPGELARLAVSKAYAARINRLMDAEELFDGKGDGAVTVESALGLPNPTSTKTFSATHTGLVSVDGPLEWVLQVTGLAEPEKPLAK
ncbi:alpha/beta fold hydrolase [Rhodopirellula sp. JC639]|uniref:alpha/beta fold hydrolase n=1 Tax=Stieleria mannarensis TaxID=2755585 RepID=UPI0016010F04|nr:alpha/beta fold hydrolase [Rhodopirellula sp. JC639]